MGVSLNTLAILQFLNSHLHFLFPWFTVPSSFSKMIHTSVEKHCFYHHCLEGKQKGWDPFSQLVALLHVMSRIHPPLFYRPQQLYEPSYVWIKRERESFWRNWSSSACPMVFLQIISSPCCSLSLRRLVHTSATLWANYCCCCCGQMKVRFPHPCLFVMFNAATVFRCGGSWWILL